MGDIWVTRTTSVQLLHKEGILNARAHFRVKKSSLAAVTRGIDRHDVPKGQEYPQGHSRTGGGVAEVVRAAQQKISSRLIP